MCLEKNHIGPERRLPERSVPICTGAPPDALPTLCARGSASYQQHLATQSVYEAGCQSPLGRLSPRNHSAPTSFALRLGCAHAASTAFYRGAHDDLGMRPMNDSTTILAA
eukprot:scaffold266_cov248-Pinguiococcus_pyrenoidosus.AAC.14